MALPFSAPDHLSIIQIAYVVSDIGEAAKRWFAVFGMGPFTVRRHMRLAGVTFQGAPSSLDMTMALAQAGDLQVELIQQHCDTPSVFREVPGAKPSRGPHHVAIYPRNHQAMVDHYAELGFPVAGEIETRTGYGPTFVDTRDLTGHMLEVYRPDPLLEKVYAVVKERSKNWDRKTLLVE